MKRLAAAALALSLVAADDAEKAGILATMLWPSLLP
jgi:hypothetical protein